MKIEDQLGRKVEIPSPPKRIISLVPSQTELLADLGLDQEVTGITKFCVHPEEWFRSKKRVGGTKKLNLDVIHALKPDLILANKEENEKEQLEILMQEFPVWVSDVNTLSDALNMIRSVGEITGKKEKAVEMAREIATRFEKLAQTLNTKPQTPNRCAYFIWRKPWMIAGNDTFIHEMLSYCGLENYFGHLSRYPEIALEKLEPDYPLLLLSSEPFPFKEKHAEEIRRDIPGAKILFVDGEMFSWYGSRLLKTADYFVRIREQVFTL